MSVQRVSNTAISIYRENNAEDRGIQSLNNSEGHKIVRLLESKPGDSGPESVRFTARLENHIKC